MTDKDDCISEILDIEWKMFHAVSNIGGGLASCQRDLKTFAVNRIAQFMSWSTEALESYRMDLSDATANDRNLLAEKYARMMKSTSPQEYVRLQHLLPSLGVEASALIDETVEIVLGWEEALSQKYPNIIARARPLRSFEDTPHVTSLETYLRGELATYSLRTLHLYHQNVVRQKSENINGAEITLKFLTNQYGYGTLEEANSRLAVRG